MGVTGVALAALLAEVLVLTWFVSSVRFPTSWWAGIAGRVGRIAVATLGLALWVFVMRGIHPLLAALTSLPVYLLLVRLCRALGPEDRHLISQLFTSMPGAATAERLFTRQAS
jgi:hypothetical protein